MGDNNSKPGKSIRNGNVGHHNPPQKPAPPPPPPKPQPKK